jgi:hypothetical protein
MHPQTTNHLFFMVASLCLVASALATDPMRTALVVNEKSIDSLTIANHYAQLRGIPDRNIVTLPDVPKEMLCTIDEMKKGILDPLLAELDKRGLGNQIDVVAYSTDFPTAIKLDTDFAKVPKRHHLFTPVGSLNGLTTLYQFLKDDQVSYVAPRINFYSRGDWSLLQQNPFFGSDRELFDRAMAAAEKSEFDIAIESLNTLIEKHPPQWPLRVRKAGYQARGGKTDDALETIAQLIREGAACRPMFETDSAFDGLRENEAFKKQRLEMRTLLPNRMPPFPFSARIVWGQNGLPLNSNEGPRYLLSMMLAVTKGRGTTVDEAIEILKRAAEADATGGPATFYFSNSSDVRSTTRMPLMPLAAVALRELGHKVIIDQARLPQGQTKLMGAMLGSANYEWPLAGNQLLPGSIADNLTSTSGVLHQENGQTSMMELLRGGAAGTSGTVTEPYALQFKFPTPLMYAYYAAGATLAEAFYLSVESPYQLLIVGDPLCRPYGDEHNELFTLEPPVELPDAIGLQLRFWRDFKLAAAKMSHLELFFGGRLAFASKPGQAIRLNKAGLPPGWHEITILGVSQHPLRMKTAQSVYVLVGDESLCPKLTAKKGLQIQVEAAGAERIAVEHLGRRVLDTDEIDSEHTLSLEKTGQGPIRLTPLALHDGIWIPGKPLTVIDSPIP